MMVCGCDEKPFPLRTDTPPKEWKEGAAIRFPDWRAKGTTHILAWEIIEKQYDDGTKFTTTQALVLKRFDEPAEWGKDHFRWILAQVYYSPKQGWHRDMIGLPPPVPGEKMAKASDAYLFGFEYYNDLPTDKQIEVFLREAQWPHDVGPFKETTADEKRVFYIKGVTSNAAGGVDPLLWKKLFKRELPTNLFPELTRKADSKK
jgi:hypothetical protein